MIPLKFYRLSGLLTATMTLVSPQLTPLLAFKTELDRLKSRSTVSENVLETLPWRKSSWPFTLIPTVYHTINTQLFFRTSQMVQSLSGMMVQPNKAIVGRNAFLHESGIHQDGVLKNKSTYEIITPESVGVTDIALVLGKHSGRNAFRERCKELGFANISDDKLQTAFVSFKALCDKQKTVNDADILAILVN
jgi:hypothetical protein